MRLLIQFSIPILIGNLFQQAYTLADRIIVGRFVGDAAFSAIGATNALSMMFMSMCMGAGKHDRISLGVMAAMKINAAVSAVLLVVFWLFGQPIMSIFVTNAEIISIAANGIPFIGMWGIWLTTGLTWTVTTLFALARYKHGAWKSKKLV